MSCSRRWRRFRPNAGPVININGPRGSTQLVRFRDSYFGALSGGALNYWEAGSYTFDNGQGGADVGAFRTTIQIAELLVWAEAETMRRAERA